MEAINFKFKVKHKLIGKRVSVNLSSRVNGWKSYTITKVEDGNGRVFGKKDGGIRNVYLFECYCLPSYIASDYVILHEL